MKKEKYSLDLTDEEIRGIANGFWVEKHTITGHIIIIKRKEKQ